MKATTPGGIQTPRALYTPKLDGSPIVSQAALDPVGFDHAAQTRSATTTLTAPSSPGQWTIAVSVAGDSAATQAITVAPWPCGTPRTQIRRPTWTYSAAPVDVDGLT